MVCFTSLCDWLKKSHNSLDQLDVNLKPIMTWSPAFSRALGSLVIFTLSSHWLLKLFSFLIIIIGRYRHSIANASAFLESV